MSKTTLLINSLSKKERKKFKQHLKKSKRKGIYDLYLHIEQSLSKSVSKETLFQKIFKDSYSLKNDYLLRDLQRHLNKQLKQFLAAQATTSHNKQQQQEIQLLTILLERKQHKLFLTEWQQIYKRSKKQAQYQHQIALIQLYLAYTFNYEEIQQSTYLYAKELVTEGLTVSIWAGLEKYNELEIKLAIIERYLLAFNPQHQIKFPPSPYASIINNQPNLFIFLNLLKQTYLYNGQQKIDVLRQAIDLYPQIIPIRNQYKNKELSLLGSLAFEYFILKNYQKAAIVYQQLMPLITMKNEHILQLSILFNYCSNEAYLGSYTTIIATYDKWLREFQHIPKFHYRFQYITCIAYIFLGQATKAYEMLNQSNISQRSESDYYYARNLYAIIYYELEDWDNCERELTNTLQSIRYKTTQDQVLLYRTQRIKDLVRIFLNPLNRTQIKQELKLLEQAINIDINKSINHQNLIVQWILKKIESYN